MANSASMTSTRLNFTLKTEVSQSLRANQVCSMFDAPVAEKCERSFDIDFPWNEQPWNVGLVVGPSGSGKSSVLRQVWGEPPAMRWDAPGLVDDFPESATTEEISSALSSVGFSTVPAWLRPHRVLSVGEQFRSDVARRLMSDADPVVVDEFTSVVDRQVAQVASHAIQRHVRANARRFVAVGCHYDVIDWLQPDWVLDMATQTFTRRLLQRRPTVRCTIGRLPRAAWRLFSPFHYMTADLPNSCHGFGLWANGKLACSLWLAVFPHPTAKDIIRVARVVTLPDYQGLGLAFRLLETLGAALTAAGKRLRNYPAHPAFIAQHEAKSAVWRKVKDQSFGPENGKGTNEGGRYCAVFEFIGQANARFASALGVMRGLKGDGDWADAAALTQETPVVPDAAPVAHTFDPRRRLASRALARGSIKAIREECAQLLQEWTQPEAETGHDELE
jgi:GNAT superfamily N-acetyltransferase